MDTSTIYKQYLEKIEASWQGLPDKPEETPESTLRALWLLARGMRVSAERALEMELPRAVDAGRLDSLVEQRLSGVPLAHITGRQRFMGIEMLAGPEAMIPRKETEILGRAALGLLEALVEKQGSLRVLDVCTGCGNMAVMMALRAPGATVTGVDIVESSVELARRNAEMHGLVERVNFLQGDLFAPVDTPQNSGAFDLITCNPPYISSKRVDTMAREISAFEPRPAFDGGPFGISIVTRVIRDSLEFLRPRGVLCFEVGLGQGEPMARVVEKTGVYGEIRTYSDENGAARVISAVKL